MPNVIFVLRSPFFSALLVILKEHSAKELHRLNPVEFIAVQQELTAPQRRGSIQHAIPVDWWGQSVPALRSLKQPSAPTSFIQNFFAMVRARWHGAR
ncbi:hypothetical protein [Synechococcus phage Ssp-JY38]